MIDRLTEIMKDSGFQLYLINEEHFRDRMVEPQLETGPAAGNLPLNSIKIRPFEMDFNDELTGFYSLPRFLKHLTDLS